MDKLKESVLWTFLTSLIISSNGSYLHGTRVWIWSTVPAVKYELMLNVYAGQPDPHWVLDSSRSDYNQLVSAINGCPSTRLGNSLGYRGFTVKMSNMFGQTVWKTIGSNTNYNTELMLTNSNPNLNPVVRQHVQDCINGRVRHVNYTMYVQPKSYRRYRRKRQSACQRPTYDPDNWNVDPIQRRNNCYNYATNIRTDTFAQPGRWSGNRYNSFDSANVLAAARRDGLVPVDSLSPSNLPSSGYCLVALVIWPGVDFHWYRLDSNSFWSHKMGQTPVKNTDENGDLILDPRFAARGPYSEFTSFMGVHSNVNIQ